MEANLSKKVGKRKAFARSAQEFIDSFEQDSQAETVEFVCQSSDIEPFTVKIKDKFFIGTCQKQKLETCSDDVKFLSSDGKVIHQSIFIHRGNCYYSPWGVDFHDDPRKISSDVEVLKIVTLEQMKTPQKVVNPAAQYLIGVDNASIDYNQKVDSLRKGGQNG